MKSDREIEIEELRAVADECARLSNLLVEYRTALETVCAVGETMRDDQRRYFRDRTQAQLIASKTSEKAFDAALQQVTHLRKGNEREKPHE